MTISRVGDSGDSHAQSPPVRTTVSRFPTSPPPSSPAPIIRVGVERASYSPFRDTFFHDPCVNPRLRGEGGDPDRHATAHESKRMWSTNGPHLDTRSVKTATCPGSAFKNQALSADRLYSTNRNSLGYEVHKSLRGTSLCSTSKRFTQKAATPESVGPGSYNLSVEKCRQVHHPPPVQPPKSASIVLPSDRLQQWGGTPDARPMDSADEWKSTSEKPRPTTYSFQRARQATWIEQIEERQRRTDPLARPMPSQQAPRPNRAEQRLPNFIQGCRSGVATKSEAVVALQSPAKDTPPYHVASSSTSRCPSSLDSLDQQALDSIAGIR